MGRFISLLAGVLCYAMFANGQDLKHVVIVEAGALLVEEGPPAESMHVINGLRFKVFDQIAETGIGIGADLYGVMNVIPITLNMKWVALPSRSVSPTIGVGGGFSPAWKKGLPEFTRVEGGVMFNPVLGVLINGKSWPQLRIDVGFRTQRGKLIYDDSRVSDRPSRMVESYRFKRVYTGLGLAF